MNQDILDYLKSQRVGVLAVEMLDGSPHAATLHFANSENPLQFFFKTHRGYTKSEPLHGKQITRASFVVGSDEGNMKTFQVDGEARLIIDEEKELFTSVYFGKFPEKKGKPIGPEDVLFTFIPKWWRFTDWTTPEGKKVVISTDI